MGLTDKLTELDEAIWKKYERVTHYCNKEFGWNKYDLTRKTNAALCASLLGEFTFCGIGGVTESSPFKAAVGGIMSLLVIAAYPTAQKRIQKKEEEEVNLLVKTGATTEPQFTAWRPALFISYSLFCSHLAYLGFTGQLSVPSKTSLSQEQYDTTSALFFTAAFFVGIFRTSKSYLLDQIMTPPKKKKSVLKAITEKVTGTVPAVPQLEETRYQSIDNIVGGA